MVTWKTTTFQKPYLGLNLETINVPRQASGPLNSSLFFTTSAVKQVSKSLLRMSSRSFTCPQEIQQKNP